MRLKNHRFKQIIGQIIRSKILLIIFLYLLVALVFTYPLLENFSTHITGDGGDGPFFLWNAWWFSKAFSESGLNLTYSDYIMHPEGASLLFHTHTYVHDALISFLKPVFGLVASFNIVLFLFIIFGAVGIYLLALSLTKNKIAAFVAGIVFAFSPCVMIRLLGHFNLVAVWPIPWFFYFFIQMTRTHKIRFGIGSGIILGLAILNGFHYPLYLLLFGFIATILYLITNRRGFFSKRFILSFILMIIVTLIIALPLLIPYFNSITKGTYPEKVKIEDYEIYSADLLRFFVPSFLNPAFGKYAFQVNTKFSERGGGIENTVFIGYTVIILSIVAIFVRRKKLPDQLEKNLIFDKSYFWLFFAILAFLLALGPTLTIGGKQVFNILGNKNFFPLPYRLLWQVPIIGGLRVPSRFSVMLMLALAILSAMTIRWLFDIINKHSKKKTVLKSSITLLIISLIIFEFLPLPFPLDDMQLPSLYKNYASSFQGTLLNIPFGIRTGFWLIGQERTINMYAQTIHGRPIISGFVARSPQEKYLYLLEKPGLGYLSNFPHLSKRSEDFSPSLVGKVIREANIQTVLVHKNEFKEYNPGMFKDLRNYIESVMAGQLIFSDYNHELYIIELKENN